MLSNFNYFIGRVSYVLRSTKVPSLIVIETLTYSLSIDTAKPFCLLNDKVFIAFIGNGDMILKLNSKLLPLP